MENKTIELLEEDNILEEDNNKKNNKNNDNEYNNEINEKFEDTSKENENEKVNANEIKFNNKEQDKKNTKKSNFKIYTKTGDNGETSLCDGSRTSKDSLRVEAYGSIDEINSFIGICIIKCTHLDIKKQLIDIQRDLFAIGSNLAFPSDLTQASIKGPSIAEKIPRINDELITKLEKWIDIYDEELPILRHFILTGGNELSALLHYARTICRSSERRIVALKKHEEVHKNIVKYVNRLSDYLFTIARVASYRDGKKDIEWLP
ncbi:MAG: cob(I)yrinic acid a,c-diamide adenosyltransferase [Candidatus Woesearchaeota archaeon]